MGQTLEPMLLAFRRTLWASVAACFPFSTSLVAICFLSLRVNANPVPYYLRSNFPCEIPRAQAMGAQGVASPPGSCSAESVAAPAALDGSRQLKCSCGDSTTCSVFHTKAVSSVKHRFIMQAACTAWLIHLYKPFPFFP